MATPLRLQQGQLWKRGVEFIRIVRLERLAVAYKSAVSADFKAGTLHQATKKEFCRLIKSAVLQPSRPGRDTASTRPRAPGSAAPRRPAPVGPAPTPPA